MGEKIVVVGLLRGQEEGVRRECPGVEIEFVPVKKNSGIRATGRKCFLMRKFIDHGHARKAVEKFSRERVVYIAGGTSELVAAIKQERGE